MAPVNIDTHNFLVKAYNHAVKQAERYDEQKRPSSSIVGIPSGYNHKFLEFVQAFNKSLGRNYNDTNLQYLRDTESYDFFNRCNYKFIKLCLDTPLDNENDKYKFCVEFINWAGTEHDRVRLYNNEECQNFFVIMPRYEHI